METETLFNAMALVMFASVTALFVAVAARAIIWCIRSDI